MVWNQVSGLLWGWEVDGSYQSGLGLIGLNKISVLKKNKCHVYKQFMCDDMKQNVPCNFAVEIRNLLLDFAVGIGCQNGVRKITPIATADAFDASRVLGQKQRIEV